MRRRASLSLLLAAGAAACLAAGITEGGGRLAPGNGIELRLEGAPLRPYRMNRATLAASEPIRGYIEVRARAWRGGEILLFQGEEESAFREAPIGFYLDEDYRSLEIAAGGSYLELDLSALTGLGAASEEAELRRSMRALHPPLAFGGRLLPAPSLELAGLALPAAASRAAAALFVPPLPLAAFAILAAAALAAAIAASRPDASKQGIAGREGAGPLPRLAPRLAAYLALALAAAALAAPRPTLYRARFPRSQGGSLASGKLERRVGPREGYTLVEYAARGEEAGIGGRLEGEVALVALAAPPGLVPLGELLPEGAACRFSSPPLLTSREGELYASGSAGTIGWVVDARR
ncbi:MAG TPA: hypothetical protein PLB91_10435 [Spirochaetales bacterium]|nr:hypothetical protein [Spirochaetales bacterium]HRY53586.1 hypothetical protein [Spirochaetia bacterium]HRZ63887.1 hypothetical protein [Spirochaetia bacterium]